MGLKDLRKPAQAAPVMSDDEREAVIDAFIAGAPVKTTSTPAKKTKKRKSFKNAYVRTTFSLSLRVNENIESLTLVTRKFKVSKSDVIRAGVLALMEMDRPDLLALLARVAKGEAVESTNLLHEEPETPISKGDTLT